VFVTLRHRPAFLVGLVKRAPESPEQHCHRDVGFTVAVIDSRIEDDGHAVGDAPVATPEIPVAQRWLRSIFPEQLRQPICQCQAERLQLSRVAVTSGEVELEA
jgi:hypothetical protein